MFREVSPDDLIIRGKDGRAKVNHRLVCEFGLFNLSADLQDELHQIYLSHAAEAGRAEHDRVHTFIRLCARINQFPFPVITNFTSGSAYEANMKMLEPFAGA